MRSRVHLLFYEGNVPDIRAVTRQKISISGTLPLILAECTQSASKSRVQTVHFTPNVPAPLRPAAKFAILKEISERSFAVGRKFYTNPASIPA